MQSCRNEDQDGSPQNNAARGSKLLIVTLGHRWRKRARSQWTIHSCSRGHAALIRIIESVRR
jgi:hypothetical protein